MRWTITGSLSDKQSRLKLPASRPDNSDEQGQIFQGDTDRKTTGINSAWVVDWLDTIRHSTLSGRCPASYWATHPTIPFQFSSAILFYIPALPPEYFLRGNYFLKHLLRLSSPRPKPALRPQLNQQGILSPYITSFPKFTSFLRLRQSLHNDSADKRPSQQHYAPGCNRQSRSMGSVVRPQVSLEPFFGSLSISSPLTLFIADIIPSKWYNTPCAPECVVSGIKCVLLPAITLFLPPD